MERNRPLTSTRKSPLAVLAIVLLATIIAGCGKEAPPPTAEMTAAARQLSPAQFARIVGAGDAFVLNVHTPDEGSIRGTDGAIPFDEIANRTSELPQDRTTQLAIYCRTGRMSREAARTLSSLGYVNLVELSGGMVAWKSDGRTLLPTTR